jgi:hypothetical protein
LRKEMLKGGDCLNYVKARELARSLETAELQAKTMTGTQPSPKYPADVGMNSEIHRLATYQKNDGYRKKTCFGCGKQGHFMYDVDCSAKGHECSKCHRRGHFSTCCRRDSYYKKEGGGTDDESDNEKKRNKNLTSSKSGVHYLGTGNHEDSVMNSANIFCVSDKPVSELDFDVTCTLGGVKVDFIIDSAAGVSVLDKATWEQCKQKNMRGECVPKEQCKLIYGYGSSEPLKVLGMCRSLLCYQGKEQVIEMFVIDGPGQPLLDRQTAMMLGLLSIGNNKVHCLQNVRVESEQQGVAYSHLFGPHPGDELLHGLW